VRQLEFAIGRLQQSQQTTFALADTDIVR
jgi:hypothetical protein